jgi:hypothetical protein
MLFNSSVPVLDFTAYTTDFIRTQRQQSEGGQATSVAKQPDLAAQSSGFENFD